MHCFGQRLFFWFLFDYVLAFGCILLLQPHGIVTATPLVFMPASLNFEILLLPLYVCQLNVMLVKIFAKKTCFNHFFNGTTSIHISNHNHLSIPLQSSVNHVFSITVSNLFSSPNDLNNFRNKNPIIDGMKATKKILYQHLKKRD